MEELKQRLNEFWRAADELQNCAVSVAANGRSRFTLEESRHMRDKALDAQILGARAERNILAVPIRHEKKEIEAK